MDREGRGVRRLVRARHPAGGRAGAGLARRRPRGKSLLDICTGTGHLAGAAASRGAAAQGVDFAEAMVRIARANYPFVAFGRGDAEALPFSAASFDLTANAFGVWHLSDPAAGFEEAFRVPRPGGRFVFATWLPPQRGFDLWRIVIPAIQEHGTLDLPVPEGPPPFRFADPGECRAVLGRIGFAAIEAREGLCRWTGGNGQELLDMVYKGVVRAPMVIERQDPAARERIKTSIVERAEALREDGRIMLRFPYLLVSASKPG